MHVIAVVNNEVTLVVINVVGQEKLFHFLTHMQSSSWLALSSRQHWVKIIFLYNLLLVQTCSIIWTACTRILVVFCGVCRFFLWFYFYFIFCHYQSQCDEFLACALCSFHLKLYRLRSKTVQAVNEKLI